MNEMQQPLVPSLQTSLSKPQLSLSRDDVMQADDVANTEANRNQPLLPFTQLMAISCSLLKANDVIQRRRQRPDMRDPYGLD